MKIPKLPNCASIRWTGHSLEKAYTRGISRDEVLNAIRSGVVIEDYQDGYPFPSMLVLGNESEKLIHVVLAFDIVRSECIIITAYRPDETMWDPTYMRRK